MDDKQPDRNTTEDENEQQRCLPHQSELSQKPRQVASSPIQIKTGGSTTKASKDTIQSPNASNLMTDADGEPIPLDRIIKTANTMSSMMMAHKIALEDDFRLEPGMDISGPLISLSPIIGSSPSKGSASGSQSTEPSLQSKVKDIVHEAYWDLFKEELSSHNSDSPGQRKFDISKQLLRDIRQKMIDLLLPQHTRLKQEIEEKLDIKIIDQLSEVESLNLVDYAKYILDVLSKLCAPVRDELLKELGQTTDTVKLFRGIMDLLELMRLDFANFTLNRFKPHIKAHSQDYEREKFNEILTQQKTIGIDGLEYTKIWLRRAVEKIDEIHGVTDLIDESIAQDNAATSDLSASILTSTTSSEASRVDTKRDKILRGDIVNRVLNIAYSELLEWSSEKQKLYPETLLFDEATFKSLGEQYRILVLTSTILLTAFAFLAQFKLNENQELRATAKSHVITLLTATYDSSKSSDSHPNENELCQEKLETIALKLIEDFRNKLSQINPAQIDTLDKQRDLFKRQILDLQNPGNRIRELARRRIIEFVETLLSLDVEHQKKKFSAKMAPPVNIPLGLTCLADEITLTMAQLVKIIRYNRKVFFRHYQDIIVDLITERL